MTYTVTKDITGQGTVDVPTQSVANQRICVTCTPGDGYQLTSFSVTRDDENSIILSTSSTTGSRYYFDMPAANVTVRAVFTANVYTVHFDANANDATGTMDNQTIRTGTTEALTTNAFIRTGYVFTGWNTASDGSGMAYADGASVTDLASPGETITLYAQWTAPSTLASSSVNMPATGLSSVTIPVGTRRSKSMTTVAPAAHTPLTATATCCLSPPRDARCN